MMKHKSEFMPHKLKLRNPVFEPIIFPPLKVDKYSDHFNVEPLKSHP
jgi:hypothetical protein